MADLPAQRRQDGSSKPSGATLNTDLGQHRIARMIDIQLVRVSRRDPANRHRPNHADPIGNTTGR